MFAYFLCKVLRLKFFFQFHNLVFKYIWFHVFCLKDEFEPGFITFRAINRERAAMAICSGVKPTVGCDTEHVSNQSSHICWQRVITTNGIKCADNICVCVFAVLYRRSRIFPP